MLLLDGNTFLTPANTYYAFDICGGYWDWILDAAASGDVASIDRVKIELRQKDDHVRHWIDFYGSGLFLSHTAAVSNAMSQVSVWATGNYYTSSAVAAFLAKADSFLIAHAISGGHEVVTLEKSEPNSRHVIKIPDACAAHGVGCITPFDMLRRHKVRLRC